MLRLALARSAGRVEPCLASRAPAQWLSQRPRQLNQLSSSAHAGVPQPPVLGQQQTSKTQSPPEIPLSATPRAPPTPAEVNAIVPPSPPTGTSTSAPSDPQSPPRRPRRRFRRFLLTLIVLSALGYAGGVYYSLVSDNFHDFFTEYVPFGEDAVAYFEEREFRKRFPPKENASKAWGQTRGESKVTIGKSSGLQARVAESNGENMDNKGRHVSAVEANRPTASTAQQQTEPSPKEASSAVAGVKRSTTASKSSSPSSTDATVKKHNSISTIDHINVEQAEEPAVQNLVKMINNVITSLNASPEGAQFSKVVQTLKADVDKVISEIGGLKSRHASDAENKVKDAHSEFDTAAKELVRRVEQEMREQELKWREEYESEREKLGNSYAEKLAAELDVVKKIAEQENKNSLLQQEITLQKQYMELVKSKVEEERGGRLAKLDDLSSSVADLERLTGESNQLIDLAMQTQHLQVAVEAVKAKVLEADAPIPFLDELVALKGVSKDDEVVSAAISTINPLAYQRGIATPAHLIDRFRRVASEVRKASLLPEDAGVASHAASAVLSRFMFQKKADRGLPEGDDVEATLARAEALLEEGDLDSAAREVNGLQGWAGVLSRDWVNECRRVLEVRQAVDVIATQARLKSLLVQ